VISSLSRRFPPRLKYLRRTGHHPTVNPLKLYFSYPGEVWRFNASGRHVSRYKRAHGVQYSTGTSRTG